MTRAWVVFLIAATPSLSGSPVRATIATSAPEAAKRVATAKPIPLLPPVTIAARPERLISIASSHRAIARATLGEMAEYLIRLSSVLFRLVLGTAMGHELPRDRASRA